MADQQATGSSSPDGSFWLGGWRVDPAAHRLDGPDRSERLEPKVMEVLVALARQPGAVRSRAELLETVWPDVVVEENALSRCISHLRKALGDDARQPSFIETIPKTGYRLIAPVVPDHSTDSAHQLPDPPVLATTAEAGTVLPAEPFSWLLRSGWPLGTALLVLAALLVWGLVLTPATSLAPSTRPLTSHPGVERSPTFSPNGGAVAYVATSAAGTDTDLFVRQLDAPEPMRLTEGPASDAAPVWLPDGQHLLFTRTQNGRCQIHRIALLGGRPQPVAPCQGPGASLSLLSEAEVVLSERPAPGTPFRLVRLHLRTLERTPFTEPPADAVGDRAPVVSQDGTRVLFIRRLRPGVDHIVEHDLRTGTERVVTDRPSYIAGLALSSDGRSIYFSSNRTGTFRLWRQDLSGGEAQPYTAVSAYDPGQPATSPDGTRLAYVEWFFDTNVWAVPRGGSPRRVAASTRWDQAPAVDPAGTRLAFVSNRTGTPRIWMHDLAAGTTYVLATPTGPYAGHPAWSPDGEAVAFDAFSGGHLRVFTVPADGGLPKLRTPGPCSTENQGWTPDGSALIGLQTCADERQLVRIPLNGRPVEPWGPAHATAVHVDAQGTAYTRADRAGLWLSTPGASPNRLLGSPGRYDPGAWAMRDHVVVVLERGSPDRLVWYDRTHGVPEDTVALPYPAARGPHVVALARDGTVYVTLIDELETDLMLVEGLRP